MSKLFNFLLFSVLEIQIIYGSNKSPYCLEPYEVQSVNGCLGYIPRYYYDATNDECIFFIYGGCGGTPNNFISQEECEQSCDVHPKVVDVLNGVQSDISPCLVPHEGSQRCLAYIPRFYYNKESNECIPFIYGGCGATSNNFVTKEECEQSCDVQPKADVDIVPSLDDAAKRSLGHEQSILNSQYTSEGAQSDISPCLAPHEEIQKCLAYIPRFYYDKEISECVPFVYGGCGGTSNNFVTKEECEQTCDVQPKAEEDIVQEEISPCSMSHEGKLKCLAYIPRFYYNKESNECVSFIYGGCGATANNFKSKEECEQSCLVQPERRARLMRKQTKALRSWVAKKIRNISKM